MSFEDAKVEAQKAADEERTAYAVVVGHDDRDNLAWEFVPFAGTVMGEAVYIARPNEK